MNILARLSFTILIGVLLSASCARSPHTVQAIAPDSKPQGARLSTAEAIRIARQTAERQGVDLQKYNAPEAHYEFTRKDRSWFIYFDGRVPMPGNHFTVNVDDRTGEAQFRGGL